MINAKFQVTCFKNHYKITVGYQNLATQNLADLKSCRSKISQPKILPKLF